MNLFVLGCKNILQKPLSSILSIVLLALGVGIISLLLLINNKLEEEMGANIKGIDMVVGAKGSPLQLILSSVYHIDAPTGNISYEEARKLLKNPLIRQGIPLAYGDNYKGFRIVGSTHDYIDHYGGTLNNGKLWKEAFEVVAGSKAAQNLNLSVGRRFFGAHGLDASGEVHDDAPYMVTGILHPTHTVLDNLLLTSIPTVWESHEHKGHAADEGMAQNEKLLHDEHDHEHSSQNKHLLNETIDFNEHDEHNDHKEHTEQHHNHREITALLVSFKSPMGAIQIPRMVNEKTSMQAAVPTYELSRLMNLLENGIDIIKAIGILIILVSAISVFISLYSALKERRYEIALMRSFGASRLKLLGLILQEGLTITIIGFALGIIISRLSLIIISMVVRDSFGYDLQSLSLTIDDLILLAVALTIGFISSIIPALQVFNIDISKSLSDA